METYYEFGSEFFKDIIKIKVVTELKPMFNIEYNTMITQMLYFGLDQTMPKKKYGFFYF